MFGLKNPEVDSSAYLKRLEVNYRHESTKGLERIQIPYEDGDISILDITNFLHKKYQLNCVLGYHVGSNPEESETVLNNLMNLSGVFTVSPEDMPDEIQEAASNALEKILGAAS